VAKSIDPEMGRRGRETVRLNPTKVIADLKDNGRYQPPDPDKVDELVESMRTYGQLQPVIVRKMPDGSYRVAFGFHRHAAALILHAENPNFLLEAYVESNLNAEDAFLRNIEDNLRRNSTTRIDDAYNMNRLVRDFDWTTERLSKLYHLPPKSINDIRRLTSLPKEAQAQVANHTLPVSRALELLDNFSEEEIKDVIVEAVNDPEVVAAQEEVEKVRAEVEVQEADSDEEESPVEPAPKKQGKKVDPVRKVAKTQEKARVVQKKAIAKATTNKIASKGSSKSTSPKRTLKDLRDALTSVSGHPLASFLLSYLDGNSSDWDLKQYFDRVEVPDNTPYQFGPKRYQAITTKVLGSH
jgi:ParB/RepB/Spo0J family partition protein